ncbi:MULTISPECIES: CHAP domain-containing protein [unclassified Staphylococcus]|uniref:CHAP domain-containing protein n=1 Tax=unclassified Staphylococcus TaxID=91994 RepID=UPI0021D3E884|nr:MULTISPECIES: CHAP domain-containing protein [unclassified Staphylococcus]UXR78757.1 CHAP domain-containing protein [Staphylococcus sp. IVB6227]UXR82916.1 CHAP domain-containing protein [Staphylococcus sp. IVB6214]
MIISHIFMVATLLSRSSEMTQQVSLPNDTTIYQLAQKFATTLERIKQLNPMLKTPQQLKKHETIKLPADHILLKPPHQTLTYFLHTHHISYDAFQKFNPYNLQDDVQYIAISNKGMAHLSLPHLVDLLPNPTKYTSSLQTMTTASQPIKNTYIPGQCTSYVFEQRLQRHLPISNDWGDAKYWAIHAQEAGYTVSRHPRVNAILVSQQGPYGHVAIVEACHGSTIRISEMNWQGEGIVSQRLISNDGDYQYIY